MFVCTAGDWWRTGLIFDKRFYPTPLQQIKSLVAKSAHVKSFFYQGQQKNWSSIYSPMLDQGWNLLIETLLRTFSFMWIRKEDTKLFFPPVIKWYESSYFQNQPKPVLCTHFGLCWQHSGTEARTMYHCIKVHSHKVVHFLFSRTSKC